LARTINTAVHTLRRDAFVDAAQRLIQTKGFDDMSIQDVLDELDASRGAFYHYFDSKLGLLEAVVERMVIGATASLEPVIADPRLSALDKLVRLFAGIRDFKSERRELMLAFTRVWMSDENVLVRDRLRRLTAARLTPLLARIVRQGQAEGTLAVRSPEATANVLVCLWQGLSERASELYLARQADAIALEDVERILSAYLEAFERILGLAHGSLPRDQSTVREWFGEAATR
jgi:AcrR family transcriptional regulator